MLVERVVEPEPCACDKCGGLRLHKLGEVASKTLECEPRRWKIIERLREKFACRDCNGVTAPPAPSHPIPRGFAGPSLLAMILVGKFADHQPLNRQSAAFAREGVEIGASTLADWVGACIVALDPVLAESPRHLLAAERPHVDDTTVPVLAKTKTRTGRLWAYLRDDRLFGGADLLRPYVRNRGRRAAFGPTRAAAECCGLLTFRAHSRSAEVSIDVGLIGLPFVTADSAPHSTATLAPAEHLGARRRPTNPRQRSFGLSSFRASPRVHGYVNFASAPRSPQRDPNAGGTQMPKRFLVTAADPPADIVRKGCEVRPLG